MRTISNIGVRFQVNTSAADSIPGAEISNLANGGFVVSWRDTTDSIRAQILGPGGEKVGSEFLVDSAKGSFRGVSAITGLSSGGFVVTWQDLGKPLGDADGSCIKGQLYTAGGTKIGTSFLINTETADYQLNPSVTALAGGGFAVSWKTVPTDPDFGDPYKVPFEYPQSGDVKVQIFGANGHKIGSEFLVSSGTPALDASATITGLAGGGFVAKWGDRFGTLGARDIHAQVFGSDGAAIGKEFLVNTQTASDQVHCSVAALANGGFVATWVDYSATTSSGLKCQIKAQLFGADGAKVGGEFAVSTAKTFEQGSPTTTTLADGRFVIAWGDYSERSLYSSDPIVMAQVFTADGARSGTEVDLGSPGVGPTLIALANGDLALLTSSTEGNSKAQLLSLNDTPVIGISAEGGDMPAAISIHESDFAVATIQLGAAAGRPATTYAIAGGADAALFSIDAATGALRFKAAPDFETPADAGRDNVYDVIVKASDGSTAQTRSLSVTVQNVIYEPLLGTAKADTLIGGGEDDIIRGFGGNDILKGGAGDDTLHGSAGADIMFGGSGNDTYYAENSGDRAYETATSAVADKTDLGGNDIVISAVSYTLGNFIERLALIGSDNVAGVGNALANRLFGNTGANTLTGGAGDDRLYGGAGDDKIYGNTGRDLLDGGIGTDTLWGGSGNDDLYGGDGNDLLSGGADNDDLSGNAGDDALKGDQGRDSLSGGAGNDTLDGGAGGDYLTGGKGKDSFIFRDIPSSGDLISDFSHAGGDKILLSKTVFAGLGSLGTLSADAFYAAAGAKTAHDATDRLIYDTKSGALYYDADGNGAAAAVQVAQMSFGTHPVLVAGDFLIIA